MEIRPLPKAKALQFYAKSQHEALSEAAAWLEQNLDCTVLSISIDDSDDPEHHFYVTLFYEK